MTHITNSGAGVALFQGTAETKDMNTIRSLSLIPYRLVSVFPMAGFFVTCQGDGEGYKHLWQQWQPNRKGYLSLAQLRTELWERLWLVQFGSYAHSMQRSLWPCGLRPGAHLLTNIIGREAVHDRTEVKCLKRGQRIAKT